MMPKTHALVEVSRNDTLQQMDIHIVLGYSQGQGITTVTVSMARQLNLEHFSYFILSISPTLYTCTH